MKIIIQTFGEHFKYLLLFFFFLKFNKISKIIWWDIIEIILIEHIILRVNIECHKNLKLESHQKLI